MSIGGLWPRFETIAARQPDAVALRHGARTIDYAGLRDDALAAAHRLAALGVGAGDRCLFAAANSPALAAHILAVWRLGGIIVLVNDGAPPAHFSHAMALTEPVLAIADRADELAALLPGCPVIPIEPDAPVPVRELPAPAIAPDAPASILFTSGSSGPPKGVTQSHANLLAGCDTVAAHLGFGAQDAILCAIPWSFDYGFGQLLSTTMAGIGQIIPVTRDPFGVCAAIAAHRPTIFAGLPSLFATLLRGVSPVRETDLSSIRLITNTGGKIAPAILADLRALFAHSAVSLNYGMTETYRSAALPPAMIGAAPSVGFAYPGVSLHILRDDGSEAGPDEIGEIVHRGTGTFLGYWNAPEATAQVLRPAPFGGDGKAVFTGDLGWRDGSGLLFIQGRRDRTIKSMGVRVSPDEVEALIRESGLVRDVAVIGLPHEMMGEMVVAAIVPAEPGGDPVRALKIHARETMSAFMQPRAFHLFEALPLTPNGKTDIPALRVWLAQNVK